MASFDTVPESRWSEAPVLAAEGYALHLTTAPGRLDRWVDGAERLAARDAFPADRNSPIRVEPRRMRPWSPRPWITRLVTGLATIVIPAAAHLATTRAE